MKKFLAKKDKKLNYHRNRQKSHAYHAKLKKLSTKKKKADAAASKISKKRGHDYDVEKDCYVSRPKKKTKMTLIEYKKDDSVFHDFKVDGEILWYRGDVQLRYELKGRVVYDVRFDDKQLVTKMTARVLHQSVPEGAKQYPKNKNLLSK